MLCSWNEVKLKMAQTGGPLASRVVEPSEPPSWLALAALELLRQRPSWWFGRTRVPWPAARGRERIAFRLRQPSSVGNATVHPSHLSQVQPPALIQRRRDSSPRTTTSTVEQRQTLAPSNFVSFSQDLQQQTCPPHQHHHHHDALRAEHVRQASKAPTTTTHLHPHHHIIHTPRATTQLHGVAWAQLSPTILP